MRPGRPEHAYFGPIAIAIEHPEGVAKLLEGPIQDLEVERIDLGLAQFQNSREDLLQQDPLQVVLRSLQQSLDLCQDLLVAESCST